MGADLLAETEDQAALRHLVRDLTAREVAPRASRADEEGMVSAEVREAIAKADLLPRHRGGALGRHGAR